MTLRYLNVTQSVSLGNGQVTTSVSPPAGQYWIPRMVRVGISFGDSNIYPFPRNNFVDYFCTLYHGGTGDRNIDSFVDGTSSGAGDITSILNGTLIQSGEFLTAYWNVLDLNQNHTAPTAGATCYLQVIGLTTDSITEVTEVLATAQPGSGFRVPLVSLLNIPPAPSQGLLTVFNNPGQGNSVQLLAANDIYLYSVGILTGTTLVNGDGSLQASPTDDFWRWAYFNPGNNNNDQAQTFYFNGMKLTLGGLWWKQGGSAAANGTAYALNIAYRALSL